MTFHTLLATAATLLLAADARPQEGAGKSVEPLRAEWRLVSTRDEACRGPGCDQSRMIVRGDGAVVFRLAGRTTSRGTLAFGTAGKLQSLDLKLADGRVLLGVYEQKGDDLVICFAEAGQARPAGTAPRGAQWAEKWKRVGP
jgi:uncharacterized protein (TIGR03067 family)